mmetsp:Transcript_22711/g.37493  ORF Transcript_22711/g.37493 Transcript_22711/m.37493 type:complete len:741 (+) Transcript_22711:830-3052(+)
MRQIGAVQIGHRQLAEHIVQDRGRVLDAVIALHHARRLELGEGERIHELLKRHAILQTNRHRDGKVVHHGPETRTLFVHVDKDLAEVPVLIFARAQIDLVAPHDGFLSVALAALRHLFAMRFDDLFDDDLFHNLFGQHGRLFDGRATFQDFLRFLVILDQRCGQRLRQFRAIPIERVGLHTQRPAEFIGFLAILDGRIVGHVDRLGDRTRDKGLRCRHHGDVAVNAQETLANLAAGVGAVKDVVVLFLEVRRTFQRHRPADVVVGRVDIRAGKAERAQEVKGRVIQLVRRDAQNLSAELFAQRPLVEHEPNVKSAFKGRIHLGQLIGAKTVPGQRRMVDRRGVANRSVTDRIADDFLDLGRAIAEVFQRCGHRAVDDLEIATTGQLLELHQRKVRLDPRRVAVHDQTDGARGRDHCGLRVAVTIGLAQLQRLVPSGHGDIDQPRIRAVRVIQRDGFDRQRLIAFGRAISRRAVVAHHLQHVGRVFLVAREWTQLARDLGGGGIGHTGHDGGQRTAERAALVTVIAKAHIHQQPANVGIAQTQGAEVIRALRNLLGGELRHHHADFQSHGPQARRVHVVFDLEHAVLEEREQVHRRQVTGRVVQEHVFRARVGATDRAVFGACVPVIDSVVVLDAGISTGPRRVAHLCPQIARFDGLGDLAVHTIDQFPISVFFDGGQERIGDADRVVGVLAGDGVVGFAIPIRIVCRELDGCVALPRIIQHALDIGFGDRNLLGRFNSVF